MTSKNSLFSFKKFWENLKRYAGFAAVWATIMFFALPVALAITCESELGHRLNPLTPEQIAIRGQCAVNAILSPENKSILFIAMILAVITAVIVFNYINSKTQIDFFHSLPMTRTKMFIQNCLIGLAVFAIPFIFNMMLASVVPTFFGIGNLVSAGTVWALIGFTMLFYVVIFMITLLAVMLCGNVFISLLGAAVFFIVPAAGVALWIAVMSEFFSTFDGSAYYVAYTSYIRNICPVVDFLYFEFTEFSAARIIGYIVLAAVLFAVCLLLYKNRKSEAATKAMAFKTAKPIIKYVLMLFAATASTFVFYEIGNSAAWLIFGAICGILLSHCIIEIIYDFDFKSIRKNMGGLAIFSAMFAVGFIICHLDVFGYNTSLPSKSSIKSVSISMPYLSYSTYSRTYYPGGNRSTISNPEIIDFAMQIAQIGIENVKNLEYANSNELLYGISVAFNKLSGTEYRSYRVSYDEIKDMLFAIYDTDEFKKIYYDVIAKRAEFINSESLCVEYTNMCTDTLEMINNADAAVRLVDAISEDLMNVSAEFIEENMPIAMLSFQIKDNDNYSNYVYEYACAPVYSNCERTLAILEKAGVDMKTSLSAEDVSRIEISYYGEIEDELNDETKVDVELYTETDDDGTRTVEITDKTQIQEILNYAVPCGYNCDTLFYKNSYQGKTKFDERFALVVYTNEYNRNDYAFENGRIPEFVINEFVK